MNIFELIEPINLSNQVKTDNLAKQKRALSVNITRRRPSYSFMSTRMSTKSYNDNFVKMPVIPQTRKNSNGPVNKSLASRTRFEIMVPDLNKLTTETDRYKFVMSASREVLDKIEPSMYFGIRVGPAYNPVDQQLIYDFDSNIIYRRVLNEHDSFIEYDPKNAHMMLDKNNYKNVFVDTKNYVPILRNQLLNTYALYEEYKEPEDLVPYVPGQHPEEDNIREQARSKEHEYQSRISQNVFNQANDILQGLSLPTEYEKDLERRQTYDRNQTSQFQQPKIQFKLTPEIQQSLEEYEEEEDEEAEFYREEYKRYQGLSDIKIPDDKTIQEAIDRAKRSPSPPPPSQPLPAFSWGENTPEEINDQTPIELLPRWELIRRQQEQQKKDIMKAEEMFRESRVKEKERMERMEKERIEREKAERLNPKVFNIPKNTDEMVQQAQQIQQAQQAQQITLSSLKTPQWMTGEYTIKKNQTKVKDNNKILYFFVGNNAYRINYADFDGMSGIQGQVLNDMNDYHGLTIVHVLCGDLFNHIKSEIESNPLDENSLEYLNIIIEDNNTTIDPKQSVKNYSELLNYFEPYTPENAKGVIRLLKDILSVFPQNK